VFIWFLGVSFVVVWNVFRSPMLDYRLVLAGSVLPLAEVVAGGPRLFHTLLFPVVLLSAVMLATRERRLVRRRWIGLPIGVFMHLVLDGVWARTEVFWWPFFGVAFPAGGLPELGRGPAAVLLELIGLAALGWCWVAFDFSDPARRGAFIRTGHLPRELAA
jgi:hypothetical protein